MCGRRRCEANVGYLLVICKTSQNGTYRRHNDLDTTHVTTRDSHRVMTFSKIIVAFQLRCIHISVTALFKNCAVEMV